MAVAKKPRSPRHTMERRDWMRETWRPYMAYVYAAICIADFVVFPIFWTVIQALYSGTVEVQWKPITLEGAGLIHLAFGSILGVAAWSRNIEKKNSEKSNE